ncbi:tol protein [Apiospora kogelbergensis]|uniref:Tol protein n=1 Tax=Apiospora kogelbergensis TaxID=1337665 RepID=A0AAW0QID9_9PEZI
MICPNCKSTILNGTRTWGYLQFPSSTSSSGGTNECTLCGWVEEEARSLLGSDFDASDYSHLYRWTVSRSPRFRESKESCIVHFRPDVSRFSRLQNAPNRSFHLIDADSVNVNTTLVGQLNIQSIGKQVDAWLGHCQSTHSGRCVVPDSPSWVPKRLVDLATLPEGRVVVRETELLTSPKPRFVTLSHCWGDPQKTPMLALVPGNLAIFTDPGRGIQKDQLPQNFKDAVEVAILLKVQYIWIDSLCILQDKKEFKTEGQFMHLVYRNSYCNIAAAASGDCEGGLFRQRPKVNNFGGDIVDTNEASILGKGTWRVFHSGLWSDQLLLEPLYRRGWVFQERMLSPRVLHFASGQVFWDCASVTACEILPGGLPWQLDAASSTERYWRERLQLLQTSQHSHAEDSTAAPQKIFGSADVSFESFWKEAVRNYTSCNLTRNTDRLLAIWGVAKLVRDHFRLDHDAEDYGVGLWSSQLCEQLAWRAQDPSKAQRASELWRWPSWSWASITGVVELQTRSSDPGQFYCALNHQDGAVSFDLVDVPPAEVAQAQGGADDIPRNLRTKRLGVRSVFVNVKVRGKKIDNTYEDAIKSGPDQGTNHAYTLRLLDLNELQEPHSTGMFRVFPDFDSDFFEYPNGRDCYLIVLTASFDQDQELEDSAWPDDQDSAHEDSTTWIHGTSLIVARSEGPNRETNLDCWEYHRIGVCNFEGLTLEDFARLEQSHMSDIWLV